MDDTAEEKRQKHKLLIELIFRKDRKCLNSLVYIIQNRPFKFGLRIKNIDDRASPSGGLSNFMIKPAEGSEIVHSQDEQFTFPALNPGEESIIWWPYPITTILKGQAWVSCRLHPEACNKHIFEAYQYDSKCKKASRCKQGDNAWGDAIHIRGELEQQQSVTNILLTLLTILMFFDGVWGLGNITKSILGAIGKSFQLLGLLLSKIG